jgi:hypothetical protein
LCLGQSVYRIKIDDTLWILDKILKLRRVMQDYSHRSLQILWVVADAAGGKSGAEANTTALEEMPKFGGIQFRECTPWPATLRLPKRYWV